MSFRVVRFPLSEDSFECVVTNLPSDDFPAEKIKQLYNSRWAIESSFRKLKYTIGLSNFHSRKPEFIKLEIWAKLIAYNATFLKSRCKSALFAIRFYFFICFIKVRTYRLILYTTWFCFNDTTYKRYCIV